jgi:hypothetical protein
MGKLSTFECASEELELSALPARPDFCFIDGEHTNEAALRDARFCARAIRGRGVIAFHDHSLVAQGVRAFLREAWGEVSVAAALSFPRAGRSVSGGGVLAVELGDGGVLRSPVVDKVIASRWHAMAWRQASSWTRSSRPVEIVWRLMPAIDSAVANAKHRLREPLERRRLKSR